MVLGRRSKQASNPRISSALSSSSSTSSSLANGEEKPLTHPARRRSLHVQQREQEQEQELEQEQKHTITIIIVIVIVAAHPHRRPIVPRLGRRTARRCESTVEPPALA
jgi:hypothetical protein